MPVDPHAIPQYVLREIALSVKETVGQRDKGRKCVEYVRRILPAGSDSPVQCKGDGDVFSFESNDGLRVDVSYVHNVQSGVSVETRVKYAVKDEWDELLPFERQSLVEQSRYCRRP